MDKVRGVNLGNWLVLEKWMGESPLSESKVSKDDHDLVNEYSDDPDALYERLEAFRSSYVTRDTIIWLREQGCNVVRVPIPYHICGSEHHRSCSKHLNNLFDWCEELGVGVLIDLHTVPYSQNGTDNGGYIGMCSWHQSKDRVDRTVALLQRIAGRYAGMSSFWGISPLNEPATRKMIEGQNKANRDKYPERAMVSSAPTRKFLCQFYEDTYRAVRPVAGDDVRIVYHDHYYLPAWDNFMVGKNYINVVMDTHKYPYFKWFMKGQGLERHLSLVGEYADEIARCSRSHPVIVGEWNLANKAGIDDCDDDARRSWYRRYADAQIDAWDASLGGFFWSLRAKKRNGWSFEDCVRDGWIDLRHGL